MDELFNGLLTMSIQMTGIVIAVLLVRELLKRLGVSMRYIYVLWVLPFLRMVIPRQPKSSFSVWKWLDFETDVVNDVLTESEEVVNRTISIKEQDGITITINRVSYDTTGLGTEMSTDGYLTDVNSYSALDVEDVSWFEQWKWELSQWLEGTSSVILVALAIWLVGILVLMICNVISYVSLKRKLVVCMELTDCDLDFVTRGKSAKVYVSDCVDTPFVMGILVPKIYLPTNMKKEDMEYVLVHENTHIRRKDYLVKILYHCAVCLHWFNPFAWIAYHYMEKDMEMSCDEIVLAGYEEDRRKDYASCLVALACDRRMTFSVLLKFGEGSIKERVKNIMLQKKAWFVGVPLVLLAMLVLAGCLMTEPKSDDSVVQDAEATVEDMQSTEEMVQLMSDEEEIDSRVHLGRYYLMPSLQSNVDMIPSITLKENGEFEFFIHEKSEYLATGYYELMGEKLVANTIDGENTYVFKIVNRSVLKYVAEESTGFPKTDYSGAWMQVEIQDGCTFIENQIFDEQMAQLQVDGEIANGQQHESEIEQQVREEERETARQQALMYAEKTMDCAMKRIEVQEPNFVAEDDIMVDGFALDYADDKVIIFHGSVGLFIYHRDTEKLDGVNLKNINCHYTQGDMYCQVNASVDGKYVYLHNMSSDDLYMYDVDAKEMYLLSYSEVGGMPGGGKLYVLSDYLEPDDTSWQSSDCAGIERDGQMYYGFLTTGSGLWRDLFYVENDDYVNVIYLFQ